MTFLINDDVNSYYNTGSSLIELVLVARMDLMPIHHHLSTPLMELPV